MTVTIPVFWCGFGAGVAVSFAVLVVISWIISKRGVDKSS
jgi:hypothetical protein